MARPARRYRYRIEVFSYVADPDGFGGNDTQDTKLTDVWGNIQVLDADKENDFGLDAVQTLYLIHTRKNSAIDYSAPNIFFRYDDQEYVPIRVTENTLKVEYEIVASGRID